MVRPGDLGTMPSWFVVLPDRESARTVRAALSQHATQAIEHPSGRPWLMGRWRDGTVMTAQAGETALALIGQQAETIDRLTGVAARVRRSPTSTGWRRRSPGAPIWSPRWLDWSGFKAPSPAFGGCSHARSVAPPSRPTGPTCWRVSRRRCRRAASGRCICWNRTSCIHWRGSRSGGRLTVLPTDHYLVLDGRRAAPARSAGGRRPSRWCPMAEGARPCGRRCRPRSPPAPRARAGQLRPRRAGLDLALQPGRPRTGPSSLPSPPPTRDPLADDVAWAVRTVAGLGNVEHHVIPAEEMPLLYDGLLAMDDRLTSRAAPPSSATGG